MNDTPTLLLVDVMPLLYRGHFAFASRPRMTSGGVNTSAIFLFANALAQMVSREGVTHAALAMDTSPTFRHERYPDYKAQREKMPEDIAASIPMAEAFAHAMRIPFLRVPGFEADDVIGTLAARADAAGWRALVFTPDKDFAQLVTERVTLHRPGKGDGTDAYTPEAVREHWGVAPEQMVDYLGLAGDTADNIPGVPGVGEKTAAKLLQEYGSMEEILARAGDLKGKLGERLRDNVESARLSRWLAEIRRDAPVAETLDDLRLQEPDLPAVEAFCREYELGSLLRRLCPGAAPGAGAAPSAAAPEADGAQKDAAQDTEAAPLASAATTPHSYRTVRTAADLAALAAELAAAPEFAFDTETDGLDPRSARAVGLSFSTKPGTGWYVPLASEGREREMHNAQCKMHNAESTMQNAKCKMQNGTEAETDLFAFFSNSSASGGAGAQSPSLEQSTPVQLDLFGDTTAMAPPAPDIVHCASSIVHSNDTAAAVPPAPDIVHRASGIVHSAETAAAVSAEEVRAALAPVFADPAKTKCGHNVKFDLHVLRGLGIEAAPPFADSMLAHYVVDSAQRHGMDPLAREFLHYDPIPIEALIGPKGKGQLTMDKVDVEKVAEYAAEDADVTLRLHQALEPVVRERGAWRAYAEAENPLVRVLADMEDAGIRIDTDALARYGVELGEKAAELVAHIHELAGEPFNIDSPQQLGRILFERLGLPAAAKTSTGHWSTAEEVLQGLSSAHPIVPAILDYRAVSKLKSTYVDKLPQCIDPRDGRVHTTFNQALTETGRLSSDNPNLQNIPVRTELGQPIRAAFTARDDDHVLVSADYSQIELRVLASMSGDEAMCGDFRKGSDIHAETAARVHGIPVAEVTREQRAQAKRVNFGIVYGISAFGLGQRLGIPRKQAADLIAAVKAAYPGIARFMERSVEEARANGFARTLLGRRRPIRDIASRNGTLRAAAERLAVNTPVQGSAADIIKLAMVAVDAEIRRRRLGARMILQIHDELVFDVPRAELDELATLVRERMTGVVDLAVPLVVDVGYGRTWLDAH